MINSIKIATFREAELIITPNELTMLICVSEADTKSISYEGLFFDSVSFCFTGEPNPFDGKNMITFTQAETLIKKIKKAVKSNKFIDIVICTDDGSGVAFCLQRFISLVATYKKDKSDISYQFKGHNTLNYLIMLYFAASTIKTNKFLKKFRDPATRRTKLYSKLSPLKTPLKTIRYVLKWVTNNF